MSLRMTLNANFLTGIFAGQKTSAEMSDFTTAYTGPEKNLKQTNMVQPVFAKADLGNTIVYSTTLSHDLRKIDTTKY